jgi:hypothetical protein
LTETIPSEDQEQTYFVQWFKRTYPDVKIYSVPNGGHRHIAVAVKMKATGQSRGVPDLCIPAWQLYIEMKRVKGGKLSPEQKDWIEYLEKVGYRVIVGFGALDAQEKIIKGNYGKQD